MLTEVFPTSNKQITTTKTFQKLYGIYIDKSLAFGYARQRGNNNQNLKPHKTIIDLNTKYTH